MTILSVDSASPQADAILAINKAFFVPPGTTVSLTVGTDVSNLNDALKAIEFWIIPADSIVQIILASGTLSFSASTVFNHPYGARVNIVGANTVTTVTASPAIESAITGSSGAWSIPITVSSASGIAANDYVLIRPTTGTGAFKIFAGVCKVSAVSGNVITVINTARNTSWPSSVRTGTTLTDTTLTGATITVIKTILKYSGCDGMSINGPLGGINNLVIVGNKTASTVGLIAQRMAEGNKDKAYVFLGASVGISSFGDGGVYAQYGGTVDAPKLCVADCLIYNVLAQHGGSVMMNEGISNGGAEAGIAASTCGDVSFERGTACGNGTYGIYVFAAGSVLAREAFIWANVVDGARSSYGGSLRADILDSRYNIVNGFFCIGATMVLPFSVAVDNDGVGFYVEGGGNIYANNTNSSNNKSYGFYSDGGVIDCPDSLAKSNAASGYSAVNNGTILASGADGRSNSSYSFSALSGGVIRATSGKGNSVYVVNGGMVDSTSMVNLPDPPPNPLPDPLPSPSITIGQEGLSISGSSVQHGSILMSPSSNLAVGATNTAAFNIDKASAVYQRLAKGGTLKALFGIDDGGALISEAANGDFALRSEATMWFAAGGAYECGFIDNAGNAALGKASLSTSATSGFFYIPAVNGTPTGTPAGNKIGRVPIQIDTAHSKLWIYIGGAWKSVTLT